jgi:hypothetical protein
MPETRLISIVGELVPAINFIQGEMTMKAQMRLLSKLILSLSLVLSIASYNDHAVSASASSTSSKLSNGLSWRIETIDKKGGFHTTLALDSNGYPQIAYQAQGALDHDLNYARWTGSKWVIDVVDTQGDTGWVYPSLELDKAGNPHIGYLDFEYMGMISSIKYAHWTGSTWLNENVGYDPNDLGYSGPSFALDANGYPHFSYCAQKYPTGDTELRYAHWTGIDWTIEVINNSTGCWSSTSLRLDANDYPNISYFDYSHGKLKYARWTGSEWDEQVVDGNGNVGYFNSLVLDTNGYPHISYYSLTFDKLKYAKWIGVGWEIQDVDSMGGALNYLATALTLDAGDRPHIAYVDGINNTV